MSDWTKESGRGSACRGCTKRKTGCHDVKRCPEWAAEVARRKAEKEAREAQRAVVARSWEDRKLVNGR